jgi:hypothetical protein
VERKRVSNLVGGLILILLGLLFLIPQLLPEWAPRVSWPWFVIGIGFLLLIIGLVTETPGLAIPACIVGGIGGLLYWQDLTGNWGSWTYTWTLIPGFVGAGIVLSGLLGGRAGRALREGGTLILISLALFLVFGAAFGGLNVLGPYWPVLLIGLGILVLIRNLIRK